MARLEDLKRGALVKGILPGGPVTVVDVKWHGSAVVELTYKDQTGQLDHVLLYRDREADLEILTPGRAWSFDANGAMFRLVSEAYRIQLAHLFDPLLAVHTSILEPLPHQITAVYGEMLPRQPLRFLLADDPGAGKTIMAGLLMRELVVRGDLKRCLICCPGNLADQWQDELWQRFQLNFKIISRQTIEDSRTGNPYDEQNLVISRLDHMSRNLSIQEKLRQTEWDLVVVDEAHKMSAHYYGNEIKETKRYKLGKLLGASDRTRHFLLMTATPHSGKEEDFQLFLALLDGDRFEGKFRDGVHVVDTSDLMRRLVKEQLVRFNGKPLFPERRASTVTYDLSDLEAALYRDVTDYVREEMNRADRLAEEGEGRRGNRIGFALTTLQRRLASSPEAIYQSIRRRRERLEKRLREEELLRRGAEARLEDPDGLRDFSDEDIEDLEDAPDGEAEEAEDEVVEQASAARTIAELKKEIQTLAILEKSAAKVRRSGTDKKWEELSNLLQNTPEMFDAEGVRRKLIIFTEHRDTLKYLSDRMQSLIGRTEAVVMIHGGMGREDRRKVQESFTQDKEVQILVATDAAGEGINLQRAHLMVNYDLPWNPNRLEQRFGRIHRIGQTEVCHMWNIVAYETCEGTVFHRLLTKLETEREALGGNVFDVLGRVFEGAELRKLLIEAIRYGDRPEVRDRLRHVVDEGLDREYLQELLKERALANDTLTAAQVERIREDMERAEARRLQPHFIRSFFAEAFRVLGGSMKKRETKRFEITHVPAVIRSRDRQIGIGEPVLSRYERICFDKEQISLEAKPMAAFVCPGHPLLDSTIDLILERYRDLLKKGAILVDKNDDSEVPRALFYLEHSLKDARVDRSGTRRTISRQMQFVELDAEGCVHAAGPAPYLDYEPITDERRELISSHLEADWLQEDLESRIIAYAAENLVPKHLEEVRRRKEESIAKISAAVKERLTKEINYWDHRANQLQAQEAAGQNHARLNSAKAHQRADELQTRLQRRLSELEQERQISPAPPTVIGGALVIPNGLIERQSGERDKEPDTFARERARIEQLAMEKVMAHEKAQGREPTDVSDKKCGYDIESSVPGENGHLLFIEVKGRAKGADTVTVTKNEILTCLNKPDQFILAIVLVEDGSVDEPVYLQKPFSREPDFGVTSVNYSLNELLSMAGKENGC
ncbi:MAG: helicase-related protein [bacterium]